MAGDDRDGAELAHRAGVAEDDAVNQSPLHRGQRDVPERPPAAGAQGQRRLLLFRAGGLHDRDQFARNEGKSDEDSCQHDAGHGKDDLEVVRVEPFAEKSLQSKQQNEHQTRDHGRNRKRQVDERGEQGFAAELELGDGPSRRHAEQDVERNGDSRHNHRQANRCPGIRFGQRSPIDLPSFGQRLREHIDQRQQ